jgi:cold shock CspA family protein
MEQTQTHPAPEVGHDHRPGRRPRRKGRAKGEKPEERGRRAVGRILRMLYGQSYGLIRMSDRRDVFFHRKDAKAALFNALEIGDRVVFELIEDSLTGPRAVRVTRA